MVMNILYWYCLFSMMDVGVDISSEGLKGNAQIKTTQEWIHRIYTQDPRIQRVQSSILQHVSRQNLYLFPKNSPSVNGRKSQNKSPLFHRSNSEWSIVAFAGETSRISPAALGPRRILATFQALPWDVLRSAGRRTRSPASGFLWLRMEDFWYGVS